MKTKKNKKKVKIKILNRVADSKIGFLRENGVKPVPNEESTFNYLTLFGFNVELIQPSNAKKMRNPDIFIAGTIWEVKTPVSSNRNTIKKRFREASKQSTRVVFDLRYIKNGADRAKKQIIEMFKDDGRVRSLMIIRKDGELLDFRK